MDTVRIQRTAKIRFSIVPDDQQGTYPTIESGETPRLVRAVGAAGPCEIVWDVRDTLSGDLKIIQLGRSKSQ